MEQEQNTDQNNKQNLSDTDLFKFLNKYKFIIIIIAAIGFLGYSSYYVVDAGERGIVLRFGKAIQSDDGTYTLVEPGLHFKIPLIDQIKKVNIDRVYKAEFGYKTVEADVKSDIKTTDFEDVSWMLTKDLDIAEVQWVVQYRISNPYKFLYKVKNVDKTIKDASEAAMRLEIGDHFFKGVIGAKRERIAERAKEYIQNKLTEYDTGVTVQIVQLMQVLPPEPVKDSFEEINRAEQDRQTFEYEAQAEKIQAINEAKGRMQEMINIARGDSIAYVNLARGDSTELVTEGREYNKDPELVGQRMYNDFMREMLSKAGSVVIVDSLLKDSPLYIDISKTLGKSK